MDFFKENQADIMLVLGGICGIIALFVCMTDSMSRKRKKS